MTASLQQISTTTNMETRKDHELRQMENLVKSFNALEKDIPYLIRDNYDEKAIRHVNIVYRDCKKIANNIESFVRANKIKASELEAIKLKDGKRIAIVAKKDKRQLKAPSKGKKQRKNSGS